MRPGLRGMIANNEDFFIAGRAAETNRRFNSIHFYICASTCTRPISERKHSRQHKVWCMVVLSVFVLRKCTRPG